MKDEHNNDKPKRFYYFDQNSRVYELDGVKSSRPFHIGYFVPINVVSEDDKQFVCSYGTINKRSMMYSWSRGAKFRVYTEDQMLDEVYVEENKNRLAEAVRKAPANVLRKVDKLLKE